MNRFREYPSRKASLSSCFTELSNQDLSVHEITFLKKKEKLTQTLGKLTPFGFGGIKYCFRY